MARIDPQSGRLDLQIVYDGAPRSGKTSSVVALGRLLDCPVVTPGEDRGRTVYFDWMNYAGGLCRGRPIQCRVLTVPGQAEFAPRRRLILDAADAAIFVVDSRAGHFERSRRGFDALRESLARRRRDVPVLLQLNRRDADDALPAEQIVGELAPDLDHVESVAPSGSGVREAFVMATGAAMRLLRDSEAIYGGGGQYDTQELQLPDPDQLLDLLQDV